MGLYGETGPNTGGVSPSYTACGAGVEGMTCVHQRIFDPICVSVSVSVWLNSNR